MSTSTPVSEKKSSGPKLLVPPEEKFWKRYSPHGEGPLSFAGSLAVHALGVGVLLLFGFYLAALFFRPTRTMPIDPVRLDFGGGGGKPGGVGTGKGVGTGPREDVGDPDKDLSQTGLDEGPRRPALTPVETKKIQERFDENSARVISESSSDAVKAYARLDDASRRKLADGLTPGKGKGGPGSGGGTGTGTGTGEGPGTGAGKATLGTRERRMLRWHMRFTANTGMEYVAQLRGLGAFLAFPVTDGPDPKYKVIRDLKPGAPLLDEDLSKLNRIYWIDDKPRAVADVVTALSVKLPAMPARFVAFMPEQLEKQLYDMERRYVERVLRKRFNEDQINETQFRVVRTPRGYRPELISVTLR